MISKTRQRVLLFLGFTFWLLGSVVLYRIQNPELVPVGHRHFEYFNAALVHNSTNLVLGLACIITGALLSLFVAMARMKQTADSNHKMMAVIHCFNAIAFGFVAFNVRSIFFIAPTTVVVVNMALAIYCTRTAIVRQRNQSLS